MKEKSESSIEHLPSQPRSNIVSAELTKILDALRVACPAHAEISFDFDGALHVHVDVRNLEDVARIESILPTLYMGIFDDIRRNSIPHRPFFHRVSATVKI
jgi:hypothetical protein